ncbi:MAG: hypothetical protein LBT25_01265 [Candidatus Symbiothrix sp.]|jgi:hypothetical protein|nr:hypothetical protein [Candidatus Symbiothrix sp.]
MNQLIIKGKQRLTNLSIEERRDRVEEASWSCFGIPGNILTLNDLAASIRTEYESRKVRITDNDIFRKQIGQPTHPITKALLDAEYPYMVKDAIKNEYGKMGWLEALASPRDYHYYSLEESQVPVMPTTRKPLGKLSNDELIDKLFFPFKRFTKYGNKLENHFRQKTGENLYFHLKEWADGKNTNKDALISVIKEKVKSVYLQYRSGAILSQPIDISPEIAEKFIDFSDASLWTMSGEKAAFGGIQEIEIQGFLTNQTLKGDYFDQFGKVHYLPKTTLEIRLFFVLKDWFGVDEEDVYKNESSTQMGRESLAAFWVLQHQRGYRPFINIITYEEEITVVF